MGIRCQVEHLTGAERADSHDDRGRAGRLDGGPSGPRALFAAEVGIPAGRTERADRVDAGRGEPGDHAHEGVFVYPVLVGRGEGEGAESGEHCCALPIRTRVARRSHPSSCMLPPLGSARNFLPVSGSG